VRQRQQIEPELSPHWQGAAAPYRSLRAIVPLWVVATAAVAILAALFVWFTTSLNATSDDLFARMLRAPPDHMPQIARAPIAAPAPPTPVLPPPVDDLCTLLKPEVDQGLITVICTPPTIIIRINNRGMFASGSATVEAKFVPLLTRIGAGLEKEKGTIQVIGYTDNQPIHTIQFPSNFQLSAARADAAKALLVGQMSNPSRVTAEGRGEADPLNKNSTPEEREQNRRIEATLQRSE
jgi:type VI secretion system protein ImpK